MAIKSKLALKKKVKKLNAEELLSMPIEKTKKKFGKPREATDSRNCLKCALFSKCKDKNKAFNYRCSKFEKRTKLVDLSSFDKITKKNIKAREYSDEMSSEFDINKIIDSIVESETGIPRDLKVDDRDLPVAKNFYEFMVSPKFLDFRPWAKQVQIGLNFFTDYCWNPKCSNIKYMQNIPVDATVDQILEKCTLLEHGICPKCKETRLELWQKRGAGCYNELAGLAGQRSAKSVTSGLMMGYHKHRYLKLPNPTRVYGLLPNTTIHSTVTATTYKQAKETLYDPILDLIAQSPWFKEYHQLLDHYSNKHGEELYKVRTEFLQYRHKNFLFYAAAPDKKNLRGRTRIGGGIDEIGWMFAKSEESIKMDANEVYTAMKNSLFTLRSANARLIEQGHYNIPQTIFCNVSSPSSATDKIVSLVKEAETNKNIYAFHHSTFEMNPTIKPIDLEDIERANPENFKRDFLAIPPNATNAFIRDRKALIGCIDPMNKNLIKLDQEEAESNTGVPMTSGKINIRKHNRKSVRLLALDAGHKINSFAGCLISMQESEENEEIEQPVIEAMFEIVPSNGYHINMTDVYENVLSPIIEDLNVRFVVADRWQSLKLMSDIENEFEIATNIYSVSYQDMLEFRTAIYERKILFPRPEMKISEAFQLANNSKNYPMCFIGTPVAHFFIQALTVEDILGKKVDKGLKRTDDIFRAAALAYSCIMDEEIRDNYLIDDTGPSGPIAIGVYGSYTGAAKAPASHMSNVGVVSSLKPTGGYSAQQIGGSSFTFSRAKT